MKKIKILVASAIMTIMLSTTAFAALPSGAIIVGDKAYSLDYITANVSQLNDILNNAKQYTDIYYTYKQDNKDTIKSLFTGNIVSPSDLQSELTYYDKYGNKTIYTRNGSDFSVDQSSSTVELEIKMTKFDASNTRFISVKIPDKSKINMKPFTLTPEYFKIYNDNNSDLVKKIGTYNSLMGENSDEYILNMVTTDKYISIGILSNDKVAIAKTEEISLDDLSRYEVTSGVYKLKLVSSGTNNTNISDGYNGLGNINNNGLFARSGDWNYYSNTADGGGIYKTNGVENYKISEDNAKFINVVGDYIYYSNYSDGQKIYRIRKDGTGRRIVSTDQASYVTVSGEYIYYSYHSGKGVGNIRKVNRDANKSIGTNITNDEAEYLVVDKDVIYFVNKNERNSIYSVHTDGTYRSKLVDDSAKFITLLQDRIYYITDSGELKYTPKGGGSKGEIIITSGTSGKRATLSTMNIKQDSNSNYTIYYTEVSDGNKIYRAPLVDYLRVTGEKYVDDTANFINIVNGEVYYTKGTSLFMGNEPKPLPNSGNSTKPMYSYSSTAIIKPKQNLKIVSYDKEVSPTKSGLGSDINKLENYLPEKVTAVMSDNSVRELLVNWDLNPKQGKGDAINYTGVIVGYGAKVSLKLTLGSEQIPAAAVKVVNNAGTMEDKVYINIDANGAPLAQKANLQIGDTIKIYRDALKSEFIGQGVVLPSVTNNGLSVVITLTGKNVLPDNAYRLYVSRITQGLAESEVTEVTFDEKVGQVPSFNIDSSKVKLTNYGVPKNELSYLTPPRDVIEIEPTDQLKPGDMVKVYRRINGEEILLGTKAVEVVPSSNPFEESKCRAVVQLEPKALAFDESVADNNKVYIKRQTPYAESTDTVTKNITKGIALPLGTTITIFDNGDGKSTVNQLFLDNELEYEVYYKVANTLDIPELGAVINSSDGWVKIDNLVSGHAEINAVQGNKVHIVEAYKDTSNVVKAVKYGSYDVQ